MLRVVLARIPQMLVVLVAATLVTFIVVNVLPGNVLFVILGDNYTKQSAAKLSVELGLNHPLVVRYFDWLWHAVHLDFGNSLTSGIPVTKEISSDALPTIELVIGAQIVSLIVGCFVAIAVVASRRAWADKTATALGLVATSMPSFVAALLAIAVFAVHWKIFPTVAWADPSTSGWAKNLRGMVLPIVLLGLSIFPGHMRIFRSELLEQIDSEEYVTLARMKGVPIWRIVTRHVARNSAFGLITGAALSTAALIGGAVILEQIFGIPGIGGLLLQAVQSHDSPTVEACILLIATLIVVMNLAADLIYAWLDPRVRDAQSAS